MFTAFLLGFVSLTTVVELLPVAQPPLVAVRPSAEARCPSTGEVEAALLARIPGVVVAFDRATERQALLLSLSANPDLGAAELTLTEADGRLRLRRSLGAAGQGKDCAALAETAALIVERYLVELDERAASAARGNLRSQSITPLITPSLPEPSWALGLGTGYVIGPVGSEALDFGLRASRLRLGPGHDFVASLRVGVGPEFNPIPSDAGYDGSASVRRYPVSAGLAWLHDLWPGQLEAGGGLGFDVHHVEVAAARGAESSALLAGPHLFAEAALRVSMTRQTFVRVGFGLSAHWLRYDFSRSEGRAPNLPPGAADPVFSLPTHRIQARLTAEIGLSLPLMKSWGARP